MKLDALGAIDAYLIYVKENNLNKNADVNFIWRPEIFRNEELEDLIEKNSEEMEQIKNNHLKNYESVFSSFEQPNGQSNYFNSEIREFLEK